MATQTNVDLLKEYIKTLFASDVIFPGILPRKWGQEFSKPELTAIYLVLKFLLKTANPETHRLLINEFRRIEDPSTHLHWFLGNFWQQIIDLLNMHPGWLMESPSVKK